LYKRPFFAFDTFITMKILNKRSDGIIVISTYLKNYYKNNKKVVFLPPMVDKSENIWKDQHSHDNTDVNFVFSGTLRAGKDNLKLCVDCIQSIDTSILDIYGVTKTEYLNHYNLNELDVDDRKIKFHGVVSHVDSIHALKNADYLLLIRENSRKNNAGFSTKLVESISCGTPIISTNTSDVASLIERYACGYIVSFDYKQLYEEIKIISQKERYRLSKECSNVFDFNNYIGEVRNFLDTI
ncbi:glycosyltransferase, partial [Clostridium cadaveris]